MRHVAIIRDVKVDTQHMKETNILLGCIQKPWLLHKRCWQEENCEVTLLSDESSTFEHKKCADVAKHQARSCKIDYEYAKMTVANSLSLKAD